MHMTRNRPAVVERGFIAVKDLAAGRCCVAFHCHLFHDRFLRADARTLSNRAYCLHAS
jgi:hypothetical protein